MMDGPGSHLPKLESEALWDQAFTQLSNSLHAGQFEPGSILSLRNLADRFGTSITPVRDAVSRLIALGVLERGTRNAALVPQVSGETLLQMTAVRCRLEGLAVSDAARNGGAESVGKLTAMLSEMRRMIRDDALSTYLDLHRKFHFELYAIAGNPVLSRTIERLWLQFGPVLSFVIPDYVKLLKGSDHHEAVIKAIEKRDVDLAEREIVADITEAAEFLLSLRQPDGFIKR